MADKTSEVAPNIQIATSSELLEPIPSDDEMVVEFKQMPSSQLVDRSDSTKIISVRNVDSTASSISNSSGISVTSTATTTNASSVKDNSKENTSMITINSDLPDLSNSLANVSQVTVVTTSHPPVIVDNSIVAKPSVKSTKAPMSPSSNEVYIVSNETTKSHQVNESSTDEDFPSLDSLECSSSRKGQSTIIIADTSSPMPVSPRPYTPNKQHPRARKLDESEVFIVNNEVDSVVVSDHDHNKTPLNRSLDTSHVSVVTVGEEIRVKDSSNTKTPLRHSTSSNNTSTTDGMYTPDSFDSSDKQNTAVLMNRAINNKANGQIANQLAQRDDDVSIIVNKKKTKPKISPDSSVGSMDSRTQSECGSIRSSVGTPSPAIPKSIDRSDAESIATTNSHDSCNHEATTGDDDPVIIRRVKADRNERSKEEMELRNLKKKTRKRTRKFEIDGVQVTTTTSKVIYGDDENGRMYDDHIFRKQELRELKMLQKQEKKQFLDLQMKELGSKEQQERRFDQERIALERTYEADMDTLARQHRQLVEKTEQQQEADLRATSKKIRAEQERDLKLVSIYLEFE